jgi:hypothetical protein
MRYFLDTEFIEDGRTIDLVSIGVVAEDGREFYAESVEANLSQANDWVKENVLPHLWHRQVDKRDANLWSRDGGTGGLLRRKEIAWQLQVFVSGDGKPEFWAYYADYDWVVVAQLFGRMIDLPAGWPMFCMDLKQLAVHLGDPRLPEQTSTEHHALADARWVRDSYDWLRRTVPWESWPSEMP